MILAYLLPVVMCCYLSYRDAASIREPLLALFYPAIVICGGSAILMARGQDVANIVPIQSFLSMAVMALYAGHPILWFRAALGDGNLGKKVLAITPLRHITLRDYTAVACLVAIVLCVNVLDIRA